MERREFKDLLTTNLSEEDNKLIFTYTLEPNKKDKKSKKEKKSKKK